MKKTALLTIIVLVCTLLVGAVQAQAPEGEIYTAQAGDWLSKIAEKYYGDSTAYPTIIEATNARAAADDSFATISDPNLITVGQKLFIPQALEPDAIVVAGMPFKPVTVEGLGIRTFVPQTWPPAAEDSDPLFEHAWRAGAFSFVTFTTTPGNDTLVGLARLLGVPREDLMSRLIGGQILQEQIGDLAWTIFYRDEGGRTTAAAATVQDKVVYQVSLSAESSQTAPIVSTILTNFEITDPTASQQTITIDSPAAGTRLTNPFELRGTTSQYPFKGRLVYRVLDAGGQQVGRSLFEVMGQLGHASTFAVPAAYRVQTEGPGTVEVAEISAADGAIITIDSVGVTLLADPEGFTITIDDPRPYASVASPVQVRGKTSEKPFEGNLNYRIVDADGQVISQGVFQTVGNVGQVNAFEGFVEFAIAKNGPGRVEVFDLNPADGSVFAIGVANVWLTTP